ncbi:MAG: histidine--tRNA ligase [Bacteroidia bacterium]
MIKPAIPKGMRDFSPEEVFRREYIFYSITQIFRRYGFLPIETPAMENIKTLTQKYGEEGDKLLFKVLNSGDFLKNVPEQELQEGSSAAIGRSIAEKGLRYDLTVPLARYVAQHRNDITFPFKRYQVQPVWRADRPQKGRYREFYQCDADVIGSKSFIYDAELICLFNNVFKELNLPDIDIKVNNRKILYGITEKFGLENKFTDFSISIDKLDKIGIEGVNKEMLNRGFSEEEAGNLISVLNLKGNNKEKLENIKLKLTSSPSAMQGIEEMEQVFNFISLTGANQKVEFDISLARGLDYYTSTIFEVVSQKVKIGSIASGGRYDDLTATFGLPDMPGVGISFGADRIYDVLMELERFPATELFTATVLLMNLGNEEELTTFSIMQQLREEGIAAEMFPEAAKLGKQFKYADKKRIPYALIAGKEERETGRYSLKNLASGEQQALTIGEIAEKLKNI